MYPIKLAQKLIGDDEFLFSAGDNILTGGLEEHYKDFKKKKSDAHVLVVRRPDYQNFGVAVMEGDKIVNTVEKPKAVSYTHLRSVYSASKAASDHLVRAYYATHKLPITISNCSNNYGPYQYPEKLIPLAITRAIMDQEIPVYGNGKQVRDWIHVERCV